MTTIPKTVTVPFATIFMGLFREEVEQRHQFSNLYQLINNEVAIDDLDPEEVREELHEAIATVIEVLSTLAPGLVLDDDAETMGELADLVCVHEPNIDTFITETTDQGSSP